MLLHATHRFIRVLAGNSHHRHSWVPRPGLHLTRRLAPVSRLREQRLLELERRSVSEARHHERRAPRNHDADTPSRGGQADAGGKIQTIQSYGMMNFWCNLRMRKY